MIYIAENTFKSLTDKEQKIIMDLVASIENRRNAGPHLSYGFEYQKTLQFIPDNLYRTNMIPTLIEDYTRMESSQATANRLSKLETSVAAIKDFFKEQK
jgi:hypothetical protein